MDALGDHALAWKIRIVCFAVRELQALVQGRALPPTAAQPAACLLVGVVDALLALSQQLNRQRGVAIAAAEAGRSPVTPQGLEKGKGSKGGGEGRGKDRRGPLRASDADLAKVATAAAAATVAALSRHQQ